MRAFDKFLRAHSASKENYTTIRTLTYPITADP
jgi:hypothetical protein